MVNRRFALFRGQSGIIFVSNGLTALAFAFILPIMSLFLVKSLHVAPALIGVYTTVTSVMTILVSQKLTGLVDSGVSSKKLFILSLTAICGAAIAFSVASEFWHALVIGGLLMPVASSSIPLMLAMIRKYADTIGTDSTKLNSQMRSAVSLLWIFGPPLAFLSVEHLGFRYNFMLSAGIACVVIAIAVYSMQEPVVDPVTVERKGRLTGNDLPKELWILALVIFFANMGHTTYNNVMPLYITSDLGLPTSYPGFLFGLTAAVEIPAMLLAVKWSNDFGKIRVLQFGFILAAIFYSGMYFTSALPTLLGLQLLNGIFYGIFVGLGITLMQDAAPHCIGKASAFCTNAMLIGTMMGTSLMGVISQYYGFKAPLLLSLSAITLAVLGLIVFEMRLAKKELLNIEAGI
ncbi:sugar efflux transporter [Photobacterium nomapromontoriensis]|uniref:sugar efflux transporter n=1 Tax=Photobacterium nomapromontoriensis TaxID=2910237 RepID=UPI003D105A56